MRILIVIMAITLSSGVFAQDEKKKKIKKKLKKSSKVLKEKKDEIVEDVTENTTEDLGYNWNIKTNPVSLLIGATNAEVNYAVLKKLTLGVGGLSWSTKILDVEFKATEYHARLDFWFNNAFEQGWYVGAQISKLGMDLTTEVSGVDFTGSINSTGYLAQFGYHWQWDNFNIDFGSYFGYYDFDSSIKLEDASGNIENEEVPAFGAVGAEFFFGWAF